jgi:ketosteroid isomerase-like protein
MLARNPEECTTHFAACLSSGNLDGLMALYEANASLVQQNEPPARGTAALRQRMAAFIAINPNYATQLVRTIQVDNDLAVLYSDWTLTAQGMTLGGKAIRIVRRQPDGAWLIAMDDPFGRT